MSAQKFPYSIQKLSDEHHSKMMEDVPGQPDGFVQIGSEKWIMPSGYAEYADAIYNLEARADDVFICTFPRSGTTWTMEMIWLICNKLDYETALKESVHLRVPFLELHTFSKKYGLPYEKLATKTTPRFIKSHLPLKLMPRNIKEVGAKVVYVARNPKDVAASYYHFQKANPLMNYSKDFESFAQHFIDDSVIFGPYWKHVLDGWSHRSDKNLHFIFYEDLIFDLKSSLRKLSEFLGYPLTDAELPKLMEHLKFENCKENKAINVKFPSSDDGLLRRGKVGGNPEITEEISKKFDKWTKKNSEKSDLKFPFI